MPWLAVAAAIAAVSLMALISALFLGCVFRQSPVVRGPSAKAGSVEQLTEASGQADAEPSSSSSPAGVANHTVNSNQVDLVVCLQGNNCLTQTAGSAHQRATAIHDEDSAEQPTCGAICGWRPKRQDSPTLRMQLAATRSASKACLPAASGTCSGINGISNTSIPRVEGIGEPPQPHIRGRGSTRASSNMISSVLGSMDLGRRLPRTTTDSRRSIDFRGSMLRTLSMISSVGDDTFSDAGAAEPGEEALSLGLTSHSGGRRRSSYQMSTSDSLLSNMLREVEGAQRTGKSSISRCSNHLWRQSSFVMDAADPMMDMVLRKEVMPSSMTSGEPAGSPRGGPSLRPSTPPRSPKGAPHRAGLSRQSTPLRLGSEDSERSPSTKNSTSMDLLTSGSSEAATRSHLLTGRVNSYSLTFAVTSGDWSAMLNSSSSNHSREGSLDLLRPGEPITPQDVEFGKVIGSGSFGDVHLGYVRGHQVAVKVISHQRGTPSEIIQAAEAEALLSARMQHPNLVATYAAYTAEAATVSGELFSTGTGGREPRPAAPWVAAVANTAAAADGGCVYETHLVMKYCNFGSLRMALDSGLFMQTDGVKRPILSQVLGAALQVANGLHYIHSSGFVHRDLKSGNVLLHKVCNSRDSAVCLQCKIADFGYTLPAGGGATAPGKPIGTITHAAPEVVHGEEVHSSADVYAFGVMLWEMYTGLTPYKGMRPLDIIFQKTSGTQLVLPPDCPQEYAQLCKSCWSAPEARPSASDLCVRIKALLRSLCPGEALNVGVDAMALPDRPRAGSTGPRQGVLSMRSSTSLHDLRDVLHTGSSRGSQDPPEMHRDAGSLPNGSPEGAYLELPPAPSIFSSGDVSEQVQRFFARTYSANDIATAKVYSASDAATPRTCGGAGDTATFVDAAPQEQPRPLLRQVTLHRLSIRGTSATSLDCGSVTGAEPSGVVDSENSSLTNAENGSVMGAE